MVPGLFPSSLCPSFPGTAELPIPAWNPNPEPGEKGNSFSLARTGKLKSFTKRESFLDSQAGAVLTWAVAHRIILLFFIHPCLHNIPSPRNLN